jgi:hypothetical protein
MHTQVAGNSTAAYESDDLRRKFLETINAEMPTSTTSTGGAPIRRFGRSVKLIGSAAAALATLATAGTVVMAAPTAANAGTCGNPDPRPVSQAYVCGVGEWHYNYLYKYTNGQNFGTACYVFQLWTFFVGCSITGGGGYVTRCGRDV